MSVREDLIPWDSQPQEAVSLNPDHPLAPFVVGGWVSSQAGVLLRVGGVQAITSAGTTQTVTRQGYGTAFGTYAGSGIINLPNTAEMRLSGVNGSMVAGVTLGTLRSTQYQNVWTVRDGATQTAILTVGLDGGSYSGGRLAFFANGVDFVGTSGSARQNAYATYGAQWGTAGRQLYVDGALDSTNANTSQIASSSIQPALGNRQTGSRALADGVLHFWWAFNTNIGAYWHAEIARDPYQLIAPQQILVPRASAGGGAFDGVIAESAAATDAVTVNLIRAGALAEAATATDAQAAAAQLLAAIAESVTAADSAIATAMLPAALAESTTADESMAATAEMLAALTEAAAALDDVTTGAAAITASLEEAATAEETQAAAAVLLAAVTETTTATDLAAAVLITAAALIEAAAAAEQQSTGPVVTASIDEAASAADALAAAASMVAAVAAAGNAADQLACAASLVALLTESATAADAFTGVAPAVYSVSIEELATAVDSMLATLQGAAVYTRAPTEITLVGRLRQQLITLHANRRSLFSTGTGRN